MATDVQYVVFAPQQPLSRSRWCYYQHGDGSITRTITGPKFGESTPLSLSVSEIFPDALSWVRCFHTHTPRFEKCAEAEEVYSTLCNVALQVERGDAAIARICLDGIIEDCQEWKRRLNEQEAIA